MAAPDPWQHIDKAIWRDGVLMIIEGDVVDDCCSSIANR